VGLVVVKPNAKIDSLLSAIEHDGISARNYTQTDCWMRNVESLCDAIGKTGTDSECHAQVRAGMSSEDGDRHRFQTTEIGVSPLLGVVIAPYAADVMVLAAKHKGVRPVQGTRADSVTAAVRHFGANLLVLEHAISTYHEMRQMLRTFTAPRPAPNFAALLDKIAAREARA
jgi:hypothetical protein